MTVVCIAGSAGDLYIPEAPAKFNIRHLALLGVTVLQLELLLPYENIVLCLLFIAIVSQSCKD